MFVFIVICVENMVLYDIDHKLILYFYSKNKQLSCLVRLSDKTFFDVFKKDRSSIVLKRV